MINNSSNNQIILEGTIESDFEGFNEGMKFKFTNGQVWEQVPYKYIYHYAYRPQAKIIDGKNGLELVVDGMKETVIVRRVY